jgi:histidine triad (HIT) family protein
MPQAPVHILIIPNQHLLTMVQVAEHDLKLAGEIIEMADKLAKRMGLESYRTNINTGADAGQSVFHAHLHLLGGRAFAWPPG